MSGTFEEHDVPGHTRKFRRCNDKGIKDISTEFKNAGSKVIFVPVPGK